MPSFAFQEEILIISVGVSFVSFHKMVESVAQQMRNCVCKMQTATIGTRPPLVASQYIIFPIIGESTVNARNLVNLVSGIIRLPSGWDFTVCIGDR